MATTPIPTQMRALQMDSYHTDLPEAIRSLHVVTKPVRQPAHGEVLIKVEAAPCNPSDLLLLQGHYGSGKTLPTVPGWEGAGTVLASGGGMHGKWLVGKKVAFAVGRDIDGSWAEYVVVDAKNCIPLKSDVSLEMGASLIINPITAWGLVDCALRGRHAAIIQTAAASQLGRMVLTIASDKNIPVIHIVRRSDQETLLKELGAKIILNSEAEDFIRQLKSEASRLNATIAFDAVGGKMTGLLLSAMPPQSKVLVYGALSGAACSEITPLDLIFAQKKVKGFYLPTWMSKQWWWSLRHATNELQRYLANGAFKTTIRAQVNLEDAPKALEDYHQKMTEGKVLIRPASHA